jgi:hypothetical protein
MRDEGRVMSDEGRVMSDEGRVMSDESQASGLKPQVSLHKVQQGETEWKQILRRLQVCGLKSF